jgi:hypothetical protein
MRKNTLSIIGLLLLITLSFATTTTQISKSDILKADWNRTICIALRVLQILSVGIAALLIMVAGLRYMGSEDVNDRSEAKSMVMRVISILVVIAIAAQVVNYLVAGSKLGAVDIESCNDLFPTTTRFGGPTTTPTTVTTTSINGTTTTVSSTSSTTTTTTLGACNDPNNPYGTSGTKNVCQKADDNRNCLLDIGSINPLGPANGIPDIDDMLGIGFTQCCCNPGGYLNCC